MLALLIASAIFALRFQGTPLSRVRAGRGDRTVHQAQVCVLLVKSGVALVSTIFCGNLSMVFTGGCFWVNAGWRNKHLHPHAPAGL